MSESSSDTLQANHIAALKADGTISSYVGSRIYDYVPRGTTHPYIVYHIPNSSEWDTDGDYGEEHDVYVHVFDDREGSKRAKNIMQRVHELLHDVTSYTLTRS